MSDRAVFDPGLQPERTELAWRRTALAIGVGSLVAMRILPALAPEPGVGSLLLVPGIAGLGFAVLLWAAASARHRRITRALAGDRPGALPGAGLLLVLTGFVIACAVVSALVVLRVFLGGPGAG